MNTLKSTIFFVSILLINIALAEDLSINNNYRDCSEINNPEECYDMGCEWVSDSNDPTSGSGSCLEPEDNFESECTGLSYEDCEYLDFCEWMAAGPSSNFGICVEVGNVDDGGWNDDGGWENECSQFGPAVCGFIPSCEWNEELNECINIEEGDDGSNQDGCDGLNQDECTENEFCDWSVVSTPNGVFEMCVDANGWNDDGGWDDGGWSCEDINNPYECYALGCNWTSGNMPGAGYCSEDGNDDGGWDDCNPDLMCATVITCIDGLLYPTACGPQNCDEPIGVCDEDGNCAGLDYEDCEYLDYCEWISDSNDPTTGGFCIEVDNNDGPPECVLDCEGVENVSPEEDGMYFCEWLLSVFPSGCAYDCEQEILDEIEEFMIICDECLPAGTCDNYFGNDDGVDNCNDLSLDECTSTPGCQPDFSANGEYEGCYESNDIQGCWADNGDYYCVGCEMFINECEYYECTLNGWSGPFEIDDCGEQDWECSDLGYEDCMYVDVCDWLYNPTDNNGSCVDADAMTGVIYGSVSYLFGDYIDFIPQAMISIESADSSSVLPYQFITYTNEEGHFEITVPGGLYLVTAFVFEESQTLEANVFPGDAIELNFLLGEAGTGGGEEPVAVLSLGYETAIPGGTVVMPLYLDANVPVAGVQFEIASSTFATSDLLIPSGIESYYDCFTANYNNLDGDFIGIIFSLEGCEYEPNEDLHIADLIFDLSFYSPIGITVELIFEDTIVSDSFGNEVPSYGQNGQVSIGALGDINADGELNVLDVVVMINFALYIEEPNDLQFWASDINGDGSINVLDVVLLVGLILE